MIDYRSFHNADPPKLLKLWHNCQLGRGAAEGFASDALETLNFAQPYFDPQGLIVACEADQIVGFVHAGFGCNQEEAVLSYQDGVICAIMVHPEYRRRGIGRELVRRAEAYLRQRGAENVYAGPAEPRDPFYFGLYGGCKPAGFLESDPAAQPFFQALGYTPHQRHLIFQRDLLKQDDPVNFRLVMIRRKMELAIADQPVNPSWWWITRYGRLDSVRCLLVPKGKTGSSPVAAITVLGLDLYLTKWKERVIGLSELAVTESARRSGYGQAIILEVGRRMREELVTRMEAHAPEDNQAAVSLLESTGFAHIDTGVVYTKSESS